MAPRLLHCAVLRCPHAWQVVGKRAPTRLPQVRSKAWCCANNGGSGSAPGVHDAGTPRHEILHGAANHVRSTPAAMQPQPAYCRQSASLPLQPPPSLRLPLVQPPRCMKLLHCTASAMHGIVLQHWNHWLGCCVMAAPSVSGTPNYHPLPFTLPVPTVPSCAGHRRRRLLPGPVGRHCRGRQPGCEQERGQGCCQR